MQDLILYNLVTLQTTMLIFKCLVLLRANIHFGDATSGDARFIGSIVYRHDTDLMKGLN